MIFFFFFLKHENDVPDSTALSAVREVDKIKITLYAELQNTPNAYYTVYITNLSLRMVCELTKLTIIQLLRNI